ncbi:MAG: cytochrome c oxidase subunit 3 [Planctomycetota bacterium]
MKQSLTLIPARRDLYQAKMVFYLFIASLGMFFAASLATYIIVRTHSFQPVVPEGYAEPTLVLNQDGMGSATPSMIQYKRLNVPMTFWVSTALMLLTSVFLQRSCWLVHRERLTEFRRYLTYAWFCAIVFVAIQAFGMNELLNEHFTKTDGSTKVYGMSFTLALLHALHVIGGIVFLGFVICQAFRNRYDHERHWAVDHCASYWHFLDVVWISMLIMFVLTR